jgi:pimeloyl-ACP methyl ester carboxylesterase
VTVARIGGREVYYEVHGDAEPPLLCVMGLGSDVSGWRLQVPAWSRRFRTIVFDNRDVGRSSYADAPYDVSDLAGDTLQLADALELERFHLVGISLGGAIAQEVALAAPARVRTLTLIVSFGGGGAWARERARVERAISARLSDAELLDQMLLLTLSERVYERPGHIQQLRAQIGSYPYPQGRAGFLRQLDAAARHEARDRLGSLALPVHAIAAEQDILVGAWKSRELASLIPGVRLSVIEGAGHAVNVERAGELNALVLDFLVEHEAAAPAVAP